MADLFPIEICWTNGICEIICLHNDSANETLLLSGIGYNYTIRDLRNETLLTEATPVKIAIEVVLSVICLTGIIGILLTVVVLSRKNMNTSTNNYLKSLGLADLGYLIIYLTKLIENLLTEEQWYKHETYFEYAKIFLHTFLLASVWLTVILAVERYIAICHPLRASSICTICRSRVVIGITFLISFCCRIPNFFEQTIKEHYKPCSDKAYYNIQPTELSFNKVYKLWYGWIVDGVICAILPFLILLCLNVRLIIEIYKSTKYLRYQLGIDSRIQTILSAEQLKITMMLVFIIVVFFVCEAPYVVLIFYNHIYNFDADSMPESRSIVLYVTFCLLGLKSSLNFILYCWFSEKFRITFRRMLSLKRCCCCSKQSDVQRIVTYISAHNGVTTGTSTSMKRISHVKTDTL